jgi:hypothetical protein
LSCYQFPEPDKQRFSWLVCVGESRRVEGRIDKKGNVFKERERASHRERERERERKIDKER